MMLQIIGSGWVVNFEQDAQYTLGARSFAPPEERLCGVTLSYVRHDGPKLSEKTCARRGFDGVRHNAGCLRW